MSGNHDPAFSRKMAAKGWLGMALPMEYGGHGRRAIDRFVVVEEMLRAGAPLGAHWVADRQTGPTLMSFGTEEQKRRFLPAIAAGECYFSIGMSEPDAGSDLAGVRTTATRAEDGWLLNGTKIWTSGAHQNDWFIVLCRTSPNEGDRHFGLSQLIVDLRSPGLKINPIAFLDGTHHFNEVVMERRVRPRRAGARRDRPGLAAGQLRARLRAGGAGPLPVLVAGLPLAGRVCSGADPDADAAEAIGRITARYWALRQMSLAVSRAIDAGKAPALEAAIVKDLGTTFEQDVVERSRAVVDHEPSLDHAELGARLFAQAILTGPSLHDPGRHHRDPPHDRGEGPAAMSGRVGVAEAPTNPFPPDPILVETLDRLFGNTCTHEAVQAAEATGWAADIWDTLAETGAPWVGVAEEAGGSGGTIGRRASPCCAAAAATPRRSRSPRPACSAAGWPARPGFRCPRARHGGARAPPRTRCALRGARLSGVAHNVAWAAASLAGPGAGRRPGRGLRPRRPRPIRPTPQPGRRAPGGRRAGRGRRGGSGAAPPGRDAEGRCAAAARSPVPA